ncbi:MAG: tRNA (N(6)-L-threonylcarbamoyladenosine(37)-C(2))-methylthiotransferase MtaB [Armatimonadota bacterium]
MPTVAFYTLGCKVNQYETEKIRQALELAGFETVSFGSRADAYVINTCTVTAVADSKSRAALRRAIRLNPEAYVVVTGCYAELEPDRVQGVEGVDLVVPNDQKSTIPERIVARFSLELGGERQFQSIPDAMRVLPRLRTRAVVKVQDGCDQFCSYCIVPHARPGKRSRPVEDIVSEIEALAQFGYKEVVLTGIRLGAYSDSSLGLPELVLRAAAVEGIARVRLSSVEPWEVDEALIDVLCHPKVCRHLHIPLQSGDDDVLKRMNRPYTAKQYLDLLGRIRKRVPGIGITTDVIAGFPGETERAFENTCALVEAAEFSRLHVFRYSPRARTAAAAIPEQIDSATKKARADKLAEMGKTAVRRFAQSFVGQTLEVLVEGRSVRRREPAPDGSLILSGFADNYTAVRFAGDASLVGRIVPVKITEVDEAGRALGEVMRCESSNRSRSGARGLACPG